MLRLCLNTGAVGSPDLCPLTVLDDRRRAIGSIGPYGLYAWTKYDFASKVLRQDPDSPESVLADFICATVSRVVVTHAAVSRVITRAVSSEDNDAPPAPKL